MFYANPINRNITYKFSRTFENFNAKSEGSGLYYQPSTSKYTHRIMSNQPVDCYVDFCPSSAIKISLLQKHVGLFTQHVALRESL